jgi:hypothetical protein
MPRWARSWIAVSFASVVASTSERSHAFCRTTTKEQPRDWDVTSQGCYDSAVNSDAKDLYWQNRCVSYDLQKDGSAQVALEQASALVAGAFQAWSAVSCGGEQPSVDGVDLGPVECATVEYNQAQPNQNIIVFRDDAWPYADATSALGRTTVTYLSATGEIVSADLEINATQKLSVPMTAQPDRERTPLTEGYDLSAILLHEVGHFLGLAHSARADAAMYATYQTAGRPLSDDDAAGICTAYPPSGTRPTSAGPVPGMACDPTPRHGFSTACSTPGADRPDPTNPSSSSSGCACELVTTRSRHWNGAACAAALAVTWIARSARRRVNRTR